MRRPAAWLVTLSTWRVACCLSTTPTPLPKSLSPSSISTWKQCPLLFKYRYIDKLKEPPTKELARGISAHEALAKLYDLAPAGRTPAALEDLFREAWRDMRRKPGYLELFGGSREQEREWGLESFEVLQRYWQMEDPGEVAPVEREKRMVTKLSTGASVVGVLDRLDQTDEGGWIIADYKTGGAPRVDKYSDATRQRIMNEKFLQLRVYALLVHRAMGLVPNELRLLYLGSGDVVSIPCDASTVDAAEAEVNDTWQSIVAAHRQQTFEPSTGPLCDWCFHRDSCPAFSTKAT